jgi:hypothetical protein
VGLSENVEKIIEKDHFLQRKQMVGGRRSGRV